MTTRLLQNVVKLLQSKIGAKLLQEGAYWRGASTLCTKVGVHCTQLHTGTKLHRSTKQKCTTRLVHRHQFNLMPLLCLQRKSGIRKENLRAWLFPQKSFDYKGLFCPTHQSSEVLELEMTVLDRLRLVQTRRWTEPWLFSKINYDFRSGWLAFATRSLNTAVFAVLRQKRDFWNLRKAKVGQTPAWGP